MRFNRKRETKRARQARRMNIMRIKIKREREGERKR